MHKYRIFLCHNHLQLLTSPWPWIKVGTHFNIFCMDKCMFCMQMPPINLDFKKLFLWWPENPGIFPKKFTQIAGI